ncbi:hypothetical protein ZIOFF_065962 [Zingiber officinale]|uniref:Uncharacterized protein n=1 Tax=Zingiber officinale TaxID=94328 RepID=A0A8J5K933_ZINOF|nr:hypothetical protein ZIOFF_065962 [Zingiber officinale]
MLFLFFVFCCHSLFITFLMMLNELCSILQILKYLVSLDVEDFKDVKSGYSITFNFSPNPYFEDTCLTKTYSFDEGTTNINGTTIKWKEGMARILYFFSWFNETQPKNLAEGFSDEVAEMLKEDLWPNPLKYFNNEIDEEDFDGEEEDEQKGTEHDDEDESGDEDGEGDDN